MAVFECMKPAERPAILRAHMCLLFLFITKCSVTQAQRPPEGWPVLQPHSFDAVIPVSVANT